MIYLASDHRGLIRKEEVKKFLDSRGEVYQDVGNLIYDPADDEVDFVNSACEKMTEADKGIFFCGSGVMVDVAANRFKSVRSCLAINKKQVVMARHDDDVNGLCVAADFFDTEQTVKMVEAFLTTEFSGDERFKRRIGKLK